MYIVQTKTVGKLNTVLVFYYICLDKKAAQCGRREAGIASTDA